MSVIHKAGQIHGVKVSINSTFPCKKLKLLVPLSIQDERP